MDQIALDVSVLDGASLFVKIADNARRATGACVVEVCTWSPADGLVRTQASSGFEGELGRKALAEIDRRCPGFVLDAVSPRVRGNSVREAVYLEGQAVTAPFGVVGAGAIPEAVASVLSTVLGLRYSTLLPLVAQGKVIGSIAFHDDETPTDGSVAAYQACAAQAALAIENAALYRTLQNELGDLTEARRLVTASNEAVRREIAERLHGPVQTQLIVADFTLRRASSLIATAPDEAQQAIVDARALIDLVREKEIRDVSHILHPCVIGLGLAPAMRSLIDRFRPMMDVRFDLHPDLEGVGTITAVEIDDATRLAAYRIVEEGLANAHKHGHASQVCVSLSLSDEARLIVKVSDDGVGLCEAAEPGLGLRLIALKVEEVRGTWAIGRGEQGGTLLTACLPLKAASLDGAEGRLEFSRP